MSENYKETDMYRDVLEDSKKYTESKFYVISYDEFETLIRLLLKQIEKLDNKPLLTISEYPSYQNNFTLTVESTVDKMNFVCLTCTFHGDNVHIVSPMRKLDGHIENFIYDLLKEKKVGESLYDFLTHEDASRCDYEASVVIIYG